MRQTHRDRGPLTPAGAVSRGRRHRGRHALAPAASALVIALMGCTNPMQTSSSAPPPGRLTLRVADAALAAGAPDMALRVAELILRDQPRNVPALVAKGDALYAMGHADRARGAYREAVGIDPSAVGALIGLGRTLVRTDPKAAEAAFLDAATRAPDNVTALSNLGLARDLQGRHQAAQAAYRQALVVAPDTADVRLNLGLSLALSGKSAEAVALLRPLAGDTGTTDVSRHDLAAALTLAGDQVEAGLVLRGEARQADLEAPPPVATPPVAPTLVAVASLARGHAADAPDAAPSAAPSATPSAAPSAAIMPLMDMRPVPVVPVMEVPNLGGTSAKVAHAPRVALAASRAPSTGLASAGLASDAGAVPTAGFAPSGALAPSVGPAPSAGPAQSVGLAPSVGAPGASHAVTRTAAQTRAIARPSNRHDGAMATLPATGTGIVRTAAHTIATAPRQPAHAVPDAAARQALAADPIAPAALTSPAVSAATAAVAVATTPAVSVTTPAVSVATIVPAAIDPAAQRQPAQSEHAGDHAAEHFAQLAALDTEQLARTEWQHLQSRLYGLLDGRAPEIVSADVHGRTFWRLRTGGFRTSTEQSAFCAQVRGLGLDCW